MRPDRFELAPVTEAGRRLLELALGHAADFEPHAAEHDRAGRFAAENLAALQRSGFLAACVPEAFGGLGVECVQDYAAGINRLARGDGATAIAVNMHMVGSWYASRAWRTARGPGAEALRARFESQLRLYGSRELVIASVNSERGTLPHRPRTEAVPVEGGFRISGRKIFGTLSPVADLFTSLARVRVPDGDDWIGSAIVGRDAEGVQVEDNWDALGMRASGSNDVVYTDCFVPAERFIPVSKWGAISRPFIELTLTNHICLCAAFLGIAERARELTLDHLMQARKLPDPGPRAANPSIQHQVAEIEVDLSAARASLERIARETDDFDARHPFGTTELDELHEIFREFQAAKFFVQRRAIEIVDRCMTATGGGAYLAAHPLSRLYRDVRAGPFMQPFSPNEALAYIARVTLGLDPSEGL